MSLKLNTFARGWYYHEVHYICRKVYRRRYQLPIKANVLRADLAYVTVPHTVSAQSLRRERLRSHWVVGVGLCRERDGGGVV